MPNFRIMVYTGVPEWKYGEKSVEIQESRNLTGEYGLTCIEEPRDLREAFESPGNKRVEPYGGIYCRI
jgi:hypothetical protein